MFNISNYSDSNQGLIEAEHGSGSAKRKLILEGVYEDDDEALSDDSDDNIEVHAQKLDQKVSLLMKGNAQLEEERDQLVVDKVRLRRKYFLIPRACQRLAC